MILKLKKNNQFHQYKSISIDNIDINKIVVSNKVSFGKKDFKYFICYKDAKNISTYRRDFDKTKCMSFFIKDENLLQNKMKFGKKSSTLSKKTFAVNLYTIKISKN